jgi:recombinational DNA repair protein RecR
MATKNLIDEIKSNQQLKNLLYSVYWNPNIGFHERVYAAYLLIKSGEISIDDVNPTLKNAVEKLMQEVR